MKFILTAALLAAASGIAAAADVGNSFEVERMPFGSGTPAAAFTTGTQSADYVADGLYHVPNYLPGYPTAATLWPREVPVECATDPETGQPVCSGYRVQPAVGRGEYIFIRPVAKAPAAKPVMEVTPSCQCAEPPPSAPKPLRATHKKPLG